MAYSTSFSTLIIILLLYIFILDTLEKFEMCMMIVVLLFIHLFVFDYIIVIAFCTTSRRIKWINKMAERTFYHSLEKHTLTHISM